MIYYLYAILLKAISDFFGNIAWKLAEASAISLITANATGYSKAKTSPISMNDEHYFICLYLNESEQITPRMVIAQSERDIIYKSDPAGILVFCKSIANFRIDGLRSIAKREYGIAGDEK